jgi:hypothetical protein
MKVAFITALITSAITVIITSCLIIPPGDPYLKIQLPEEYEYITKEDNLKGYYDTCGVLHIRFNNNKIN